MKNVLERWEQGIPHHPKSIALYEKIAEADLEYGNDFFWWTSGGDGDNGEHLMFLLDIIMEEEEDKNLDRAPFGWENGTNVR